MRASAERDPGGSWRDRRPAAGMEQQAGAIEPAAGSDRGCGRGRSQPRLGLSGGRPARRRPGRRAGAAAPVKQPALPVAQQIVRAGDARAPGSTPDGASAAEGATDGPRAAGPATDRPCRGRQAPGAPAERALYCGGGNRRTLRAPRRGHPGLAPAIGCRAGNGGRRDGASTPRPVRSPRPYVAGPAGRSRPRRAFAFQPGPDGRGRVRRSGTLASDVRTCPHPNP
jgi:hypothetical protein